MYRLAVSIFEETLKICHQIKWKKELVLNAIVAQQSVIGVWINTLLWSVHETLRLMLLEGKFGGKRM